MTFCDLQGIKQYTELRRKIFLAWFSQYDCDFETSEPLPLVKRARRCSNECAHGDPTSRNHQACMTITKKSGHCVATRWSRYAVVRRALCKLCVLLWEVLGGVLRITLRKAVARDICEHTTVLFVDRFVWVPVRCRLLVVWSQQWLWLRRVFSGQGRKHVNYACNIATKGKETRTY